MIVMDLTAQKKAVEVIEYILAKQGGATCTVEQIMAKFGITFEEYRVCMNLAMPAIRQQSDKVSNARRASYYNGLAKAMKKRQEDAEGRLRALRAWLESYLNPTDSAKEGGDHEQQGTKEETSEEDPALVPANG